MYDSILALRPRKFTDKVVYFYSHMLVRPKTGEHEVTVYYTDGISESYLVLLSPPILFSPPMKIY